MEFNQSNQECKNGNHFDRRRFLKTAAAGASSIALASSIPSFGTASEAKSKSAESVAKILFESLTPGQKEKIAFAWDYIDKERGLLRTRVQNNWKITDEIVNTSFYTKDQQQMVRSIFEGIIHPDWHARFDKQLQDDSDGFGEENAIAFFGSPDSDQFEFVFTGRHITLRSDGNSADNVAFGGPIFYGHAADGDSEGKDHEGNVFWPQALEANKVYQMLDGKQRKMAEVNKTISEQQVGFRGAGGDFPGMPVSEMSGDQKEAVQKVLAKLIEPFRETDQEEVNACIKKQGGLDACHLTFFTDNDIGEDKVWDNWRLEGPSFVWHFRGAPHVHVWVNIADDAGVKLNAG